MGAYSFKTLRLHSVLLLAVILAACESNEPDIRSPTSTADSGAAVSPDAGGAASGTIADGSMGVGRGAADAAPLSDAAGAPQADASSHPPDAGTTASGSCTARFTTATRVSVDVSWPDALGFLAGRGKLQLWSKDTYTPDASGYTLETAPCGISQPVITTSPLLDGIQISYAIPTATFELPTMPRFAGRSEWKGGMLVTAPGPFVLGTQFSDPAAPWPARTALVPVDHDGDGKPGITASPTPGGKFGMFPIDITFTVFADEVHTASRTMLGRSATRAGCSERIEGSVEPLGFDIAIVGCHVLNRGECTASEVRLLANNSPTYALGGEGKWTSLPIAETATCTEVVAALPAE
jgi:hypothetical protein